MRRQSSKRSKIAKRIWKRPSRRRAAHKWCSSKRGKKHLIGASRRYWNNPGSKQEQSDRKILWWDRRKKKQLSKVVKKRLRSAAAREGLSKRARKNYHHYEHQIQSKLEKQGWEVLSLGWPDFACTKGRIVMFVEAKAPNHQLSPVQEKMHEIFESLGLKVRIMKP